MDALQTKMDAVGLLSCYCCSAAAEMAVASVDLAADVAAAMDVVPSSGSYLSCAAAVVTVSKPYPFFCLSFFCKYARYLQNKKPGLPIWRSRFLFAF